jgi:hypothetical protein
MVAVVLAGTVSTGGTVSGAGTTLMAWVALALLPASSVAVHVRNTCKAGKNSYCELTEGRPQGLTQWRTQHTSMKTSCMWG